MDRNVVLAKGQRMLRMVSAWYLAIAVAILAMVVLGGLVRLTGSGLSIVEWDLIMGAVPPLSQQHWDEVFAAYRQFPEYQMVNHGMSLSEFKFIFLMEYSHRLLGRLLGLMFMVPFVVFLMKRALSHQQIRESVWLLFLGGSQGLMGWYMVKSGLVDVPRVSHFRLAAHLDLALIVFSLSLWLSWQAFFRSRSVLFRRTNVLGLGVLMALFIQITLGAFVSGLHAGHMFNTFPLMDQVWLPKAAWQLEPVWLNLVQNPIMIQFLHRSMAYFVTILVAVYSVWMIRKGFTRIGTAMSILLVLQVCLGIATLLKYVPLSLASAHQTVAFVLWAVVLFATHRANKLG